MVGPTHMGHTPTLKIGILQYKTGQPFWILSTTVLCKDIVTNINHLWQALSSQPKPNVNIVSQPNQTHFKITILGRDRLNPGLIEFQH